MRSSRKAPKVASLRVGNDLSRISSKVQALADQLIETELLRSGDLDGSVDGLANSRARTALATASAAMGRISASEGRTVDQLLLNNFARK